MNTRTFSKLSLVSVAAILFLAAVQFISVKAENIGVTGFRTPLMSDVPPSIPVFGFRTPLMSDVPPSIAVFGFRTPPMSDFVPSFSVAGSLSNSRLARIDALELQKDALPWTLQDARLARIDALELQKDVIP
jgi:hypothetical protein